MTTWNHRIVHARDPKTGEEYYEFAEVYYDDDGKPNMYGRPFLHGESVDDLLQTAERLVKAAYKPVLEHDYIIKNDSEQQ